MGLTTVALVLYPLFVARGVRRSKRQGNIMASTFRRRHSWRWWLWTACGRPGFCLHTGGRLYVWLPFHRLLGRPAIRGNGRYKRPPLTYGLLRLPARLGPAHYRRTPSEQALVDAKQAYVRGFIDEHEMEHRIDEAALAS